MKQFFTKKKIIIFAVLLLIVGFFVFRKKGPDTSIQTDTVKKQDLKQTVLATGQVTSQTDLSLSFKTSGVVSKVNAKVGDKVSVGQILATLTLNDQAARLTQAQGALAQAQANLQKVLDGASSEEVAVAQVALDSAELNLDNTKKQQQVLVASAYKALLNSGISAIPSIGNSGNVTATITGTYLGNEMGDYKLSLYATGGSARFQISGLESGDGIVDVSPQPLGTRGLYIQFSSINVPTGNTWVISIPNTQASTYLANFNAYQSALETQRSSVVAAENAVASAQAALDLKKAAARPADISVAKAQVLSAQGQVLAAQADIENSLIRAPASGTLTRADIKVGELASPSQVVMVVQDVNNLHIEANISEANIASVKLSQPVEITFDALGTDRKFKGTVQQIDPASTVVSGVVNYKVTVGLDKLDDIKPGMTANLNILTAEKSQVLSVPSRAIISQDTKKMVKAITDTKKKTYKLVEVSTGLEADGGLVEITSGLSEGQEIVTFMK